MAAFANSDGTAWVTKLVLSPGEQANTTRGRAAVGSERMEVQARKFYSQRNMYLTGFTLFLSLILNRTYIMILDVLRLEEKLKMYEGDKAAGGKEGEKLSPEYRADQIGQLKRDIEKKDKEIKAIKSQSEGLRKEYDELSVKYNNLNPGSGAGDKKGLWRNPWTFRDKSSQAELFSRPGMIATVCLWHRKHMFGD